MKYVIPILLIIFGLIAILKPSLMIQIDRKIFKKKDTTSIESRMTITRITGFIAVTVGIITFIL